MCRVHKDAMWKSRKTVSPWCLHSEFPQGAEKTDSKIYPLDTTVFAIDKAAGVPKSYFFPV